MRQGRHRQGGRPVEVGSGHLTLHPLVVGVVGGVLAGVQLSGWAALGALVAPRWTQKDASAALAVHLLVGSALTAAAAALLSWAGQVSVAAAVITGVPLVALAMRRRQVLDLARTALAGYRASVRGLRWAPPLVVVTLALYWVDAIVPPRDADVVRYHLAHIRQIVRDGAWTPIPDFHYALPFGWTLNYLPYEMLHVPEVAHLLNLGLWLVLLAGTLSALRRWCSPTTALLLCTALAWQPFLVKAATTARADSYAIFIVFAISVLLIRLADGEGDVLAPLGFVSWVGAQSRYQLVAVGLATTGVVAWMILRQQVPVARAARFAGGAAAALALSAPFYVVNLMGLRNPVWPLLIPQINGLATYGDRVADNYERFLTGTFSWRFLLDHLRALRHRSARLSGSLAAVRISGGRLAASRCRGALPRRLRGALLLDLGRGAAPAHERFSLFFVGALGVGAGAVLGEWEAWKPTRIFAQVTLIVLIALDLGLSTVYLADSVRYVATGNLERFHASTWYYRTYDWINHSTPPDARFLLIVSSGHSYYLDRAYRRADPHLTGEVDWEAVQTGESLDQVLERGGYRYLLFEDRVWNADLGGRQMSDAIADATRKGMLREVRRFDEPLTTGRVRGIIPNHALLRLLERTAG